MKFNRCYGKFLRLTSDKLGSIFTCGGKAGVVAAHQELQLNTLNSSEAKLDT
jgi:hypothetical protein